MITTRRHLLQWSGSLGLAALIAPPARATGQSHHAVDFAGLESTYGIRLGVSAWDSATGARLQYRSAERFAIMSVFKVLAVGCLLRDHDRHGRILDTPVPIRERDLVENSPITEQHVGGTLTYEELCDAALRYSDNTAGNLLLRRIGGPGAITCFARSIGDHRTRLDRTEPTLNTALPGDPRDTTTAGALTHDLWQLLLGDALPHRARTRLRGWMLTNTTSGPRFRAALPSGWSLADKTGSGDYGSANDVGVFYRPDRSAVVLSVLTTRSAADAPYANAALAETARSVLAAF